MLPLCRTNHLPEQFLGSGGTTRQDRVMANAGERDCPLQLGMGHPALALREPAPELDSPRDRGLDGTNPKRRG